ncbi:hypothetical protein EVAR_88084_1 [Eumeta japonica]|uniref:Uncharacterized protein n=1 Tax=Eumeta variegata TaxID=151549 RepID=A0A4C1WFV7_EUMVA|nr:hypothetical protein EVAR_88084_1 [Eumeta japonica]
MKSWDCQTRFEPQSRVPPWRNRLARSAVNRKSPSRSLDTCRRPLVTSHRKKTSTENGHALTTHQSYRMGFSDEPANI